MCSQNFSQVNHLETKSYDMKLGNMRTPDVDTKSRIIEIVFIFSSDG